MSQLIHRRAFSVAAPSARPAWARRDSSKLGLRPKAIGCCQGVADDLGRRHRLTVAESTFVSDLCSRASRAWPLLAAAVPPARISGG